MQTTEVYQEVKEKGIYQPDFEKSFFTAEISALKELYDFTLKAFNHVNNTDLPGLIFGFCMSNETSIAPIPDYRTFYQMIKIARPAIESLWKKLLKRETSVIMELDYPDTFDGIFLDINDFQFLMPPIIVSYPYREEDVERICSEMMQGIAPVPVMPSGVTQVHAPFIRAENITAMYPMFEFI
ncbi:MAG: hypothetical protein HDT26_13865 [Subdoligranulum sp.]|nr:hypothetical protein [Subdoligranulum sp.]